MKTLAAIAALVAFITTPVLAADMATKAPPPAAAQPAPTWTGWYTGVNGGWGWLDKKQNIVITTSPALGGYPATTTGTDPKGGFGGVTVGYNWQRGNVVFGLEADIDASSIRNSFSGRVINAFGDTLTTAEKDLNYVSTIRGRLGFAFNNVLVYGTGGFAFGGVKNNLVDTLFVPPGGTVTMQRDTTERGYVVGGGIEYLIAPRWSLKAEYQYIDLGSYTLSSPEVPPSGFIFSTNKIVNEFHTVRAGLNWHF
jgi:outer membrane immunogenic protein